MKLFYESPGLGSDQVWQKKNCDGVNGTKHLCWWTWIVLLFTLGQPSMDFGPILAEIWTNDLRHSTQLGSGLASIIKVFIAFLMFPLFTADTIQRNGFSISAFFCCEKCENPPPLRLPSETEPRPTIQTCKSVLNPTVDTISNFITRTTKSYSF